jgi:hypothetical protein
VKVKRLSIALLLALYALLSLGVQLHLHYCCGQLSDMHFFSSPVCHHSSEDKNDHCCQKTNCCSYVHIDLSIDDSHQPSENARFIPFAELGKTEYVIPTSLSSIHAVDCFSERNIPPPDNKKFLLFHALVLYA